MQPTSRPYSFRGRDNAWPLGDGRVSAGEHRPLEFARRHWLSEHVTLEQVEAEIANDKKVRLSFHAFGDRSCAGVARNCHDLRAVRLFDPVVGAALDIFSIDLHFDDR